MGQKISEMTDVGAGALSTDQLELARSSSSTSFRIALSALATFIRAVAGPLAGTTLTLTANAIVATGLVVTAGGLTVTAGGLTVTAGGLTVSAGTTAVQALTATTATASAGFLASGGLIYGGGDVGFTATAASQNVGLYSLSTGGPTMLFDHRAVANTGTWLWRNGTSGASTQMSLSATGLLTLTGGLVATAVTASTVTAGHICSTGAYAPGATTPSVAGVSMLSISNGSPTTITNFTGGVEGQILTLHFFDANTTITRANALLVGGVNYVSGANRTLVLQFNSANWREISRSTVS